MPEKTKRPAMELSRNDLASAARTYTGIGEENRGIKELGKTHEGGRGEGKWRQGKWRGWNRLELRKLLSSSSLAFLCNASAIAVHRSLSLSLSVQGRELSLKLLRRARMGLKERKSGERKAEYLYWPAVTDRTKWCPVKKKEPGGLLRRSREERKILFDRWKTIGQNWGLDWKGHL